MGSRDLDGFSDTQRKMLETIYSLALNYETKAQRDLMKQSIQSRLREFKEILQAVTRGNQVLIKRKPKFDPSDDVFELRQHSNRGSQYRGVSKNGKKWQVSFRLKTFLINEPVYYNLTMITLESKTQTLDILITIREFEIVADVLQVMIMGRCKK